MKIEFFHNKKFNKLFWKLAIKSQLLSLTFEVLCQSISSLTQETELSLLTHSALPAVSWFTALLCAQTAFVYLQSSFHSASSWCGRFLLNLQNSAFQTSPGSENSLLWGSHSSLFVLLLQLICPILNYFIYTLLWASWR